MKISRILLDLDCCLADFVGGCCAAWGLTTTDVLPYWQPGVYGMNDPLAKALGNFDRPMTDAQFWERLNGRAEFWADLKPLPWFTELIELASTMVGIDNVHIISSPSWCPSSYAGKVTWLKRMFGPSFNRFALIPHKEIFSMPGAVLIDDCDANCDKFVYVRDDQGRIIGERGGKAVVFPAHHNSEFVFKHDPMMYVKRELDALSGR